MAEKNLSPRQKMIGMMYLVLMAMLALNVQREILDAFVVLNEGNETSTKAAFDRNVLLYNEFKFAYNLDPEKCADYWQSAQTIRKSTDELVSWIGGLKSEVVVQNENVDESVADTLSLAFMANLDRYDHTTRILVGQKEDGSEGKAQQLKLRITELTNSINAELLSVNADPVEMAFDFDDRQRDGKNVPWEMHTFYESPMAAVYAILSKIEGDLRTMEYNAVSQLMSRIDVDDIPVDTVLAKVIPQSNYVILGDDYTSDIFLGAYSTTIEPEILIGDLDENGKLIGDGQKLEIENGVGKFSLRPTAQGWQNYEGVVRVQDKQGLSRDYPFSQEFLVAKPSAVVSASKMNAMYIGPKNPLTISVPGVADDQLKVQITGAGNRIVKTGPGQFEAQLANSSPRDIEVVTSCTLPSGVTKEMGRSKFRVKPLPEPQVRFGSIRYKGQGNKTWCALQNLIPEYGPDFVFDLPLEIESYKLVIIKPDGSVVDKVNNARRLSNDQKEAISGLRPGQDFWIEDIKVKDSMGKVWNLPSIKVRIIRS